MQTQLGCSTIPLQVSTTYGEIAFSYIYTSFGALVEILLFHICVKKLLTVYASH